MLHVILVNVLMETNAIGCFIGATLCGSGGGEGEFIETADEDDGVSTPFGRPFGL